MGVGGRAQMAGFLLGTLLVAPWTGGCVSLARSEIGSAPTPEVVAQLEEGTSFGDVLATCGVPFEIIEQPDGRLLVYRERHYRFRRVGFEPALLVGLVDITGALRAALANLKLVFEWGRVEERRLVVLFDRDERLLAVAYRDVDGARGGG